VEDFISSEEGFSDEEKKEEDTNSMDSSEKRRNLEHTTYIFEETSLNEEKKIDPKI